ncbi:MAG: hypothetical protein J5J00_07270 [Deltaproteobacteria bacterium]|nr:hypothetical protein [Deltaproteobacteria bacterium]
MLGGVEHATPGIALILAIVLYCVIHYIRKARAGKEIYVRRVPGIDAIDEAVGRTAELGRPLSFSTGLSDVGPVLYACLGVLFYVARKAAQYKSKLFVPQYSPEAMAIVEDTVRDSYRSAGKSSNFDPQSIVFLSSDQFAFASGYMGLVHREKVASTFLFGTFYGEALVLAEAGQQVGAMQIAACINPEQVPFFICTCDYTLIGEELFASSAYLSREPVQLGSLAGQDRAKLLFMIFIIVGVGIATFNSIFPASAIPNIEYYVFDGQWMIDGLKAVFGGQS